jgi:hypothetical protein
MARVDHYSFGRIVIEDLAEVLPELPERLLIGTGMDGRCPAPDLLS